MQAEQHAILFDMDDTLFLTREIKWAQHKYTAEKFWGQTLEDEVLRRHWGEPFDIMIGHLYNHVAPVEEMREAVLSSAEQFQKLPMPGAGEVLTTLLDRGHPVGIVTSANTKPAMADIIRFGFPHERLLTVQGADQTPFHKPDPRVFDGLLEKLRSVGVQRVTYVGDALMDAQAAYAAGLDFIAVTTGLFTTEEFPEGTVVIEDIGQLPALLES